MSPELRTAVQERIDLGYSKDAIAAELKAAGYDEATIHLIYQEVSGSEVADIPPAHEIPPSVNTDQVQVSGADVPSASHQTAALPGVSDLFAQGWTFLTRHPELLIYLSIPNLVVVFSEFFFGTEQIGLSGLISLCAILAYVVVMGMVLFTATHADRDVSVNEAFAWIKENAGSYVWISILSVLVVWGGLFLFIIPGLIIGVYISLSQYALAAEGVRGFAALQRSHELVKGNWWAVAGRIFLLALMTILVVVVAFFVLALLISGLADTYADLMIELASVVVGAGATMIFFHAYGRIFAQLAGRQPRAAVEGGKKMYVTFSVLGLLFPILVIILAAVAAVNLEDGEGVRAQDVLQVQAQMSAAGIRAETVMSETGRYEGVCAEIESTVTAALSVRCNDASDAWAMSARIGTDMWCIDSTGYNKRIEKSLGERTACLDLPQGE